MYAQLLSASSKSEQIDLWSQIAFDLSSVSTDLLFKAPASMAFEIPIPIVAYYVQYAIHETNPNAVQSMVVNFVVGGSLLAIPAVVKLTQKCVHMVYLSPQK